MAKRERWYFTKEELENSPSRKCGIDSEKEHFYRQQAANLIQDMGQKLKVTQLVINTAIVYMHRFYTFHSFTKFHRNAISACALFLAAKVEEQPRKLEHVIRVSQLCIFRETLDIKSEQFQRLAAELVYNENLMLRTLGFDLNVQHPHTSIVNCCQLVRATKYIAETSYYLATNSLHLSTLCLQYKPTVVACICIYFVCKWSNFQFAKSSEGKDWWTYVDQTVNKEMLEKLMGECLLIFEKCPQRLKKCLNVNKINNNNKLSNNPSMKPIEDINRLQHDKQITKDTSSKVNLLDSRQNKSLHFLPTEAGKELQNSFNEGHSKKDTLFKPELSHSDTSTNRFSSNKQLFNHQSSQSTNVFTKESSPFSSFIPSNTIKNFSSKDMSFIEDRLKPKDSVNNSSFFDNKSNLSVIPQNQLIGSNNNLTNNAFSESLDSHSLFSNNDTSDLTDFTLTHKKDFMPELKMEFSDNEDSNPSENNLSFASTLMMNDSNDSKSLTHTFSNKPNFETISSLKPNSFSQFSLQGLPSNSMKPDEKLIEPNHDSINAMFHNSESKFNLPPALSNNVLTNPLLFQNQIPSNPLQSEQPFMELDSKIDSLGEKSTFSSLKSTNQKTELSKNISTDSFALMNTNTFSEMNSSTSTNITSKPLPALSKQFNENTKSIFSQSLTFSNNQEQSDNASDQDGSNSGSGKKKHKHKEHKKKHKHKEHKKKHKHKDKDKSSFKVSPSSNEPEKPLAPIRLKISKAVLQNNSSTSETPPLKLKISLANHQTSESPTEVSKKRKHEHSTGHANKFSKK